eukprot:scaffold133393_cov79-Phaeocystis_antarctica.AAC.3
MARLSGRHLAPLYNVNVAVLGLLVQEGDAVVVTRGQLLAHDEAPLDALPRRALLPVAAPQPVTLLKVARAAQYAEHQQGAVARLLLRRAPALVVTGALRPAYGATEPLVPHWAVGRLDSCRYRSSRHRRHSCRAVGRGTAHVRHEPNEAVEPVEARQDAPTQGEQQQQNQSHVRQRVVGPDCRFVAQPRLATRLLIAGDERRILLLLVGVLVGVHARERAACAHARRVAVQPRRRTRGG